MEKEIKELINIIINLEHSINNLRYRISQVEKPINKKTDHHFYNRDLVTNTYLVNCAKTGGNFSTGLWKNDIFPKNICPCCGNIVLRKYGGKND